VDGNVSVFKVLKYAEYCLDRRFGTGIANKLFLVRGTNVTERLNLLLMHPISEVLQEVPTLQLVDNLQIHPFVNEL
jgi:hypothetical protein